MIMLQGLQRHQLIRGAPVCVTVCFHVVAVIGSIFLLEKGQRIMQEAVSEVQLACLVELIFLAQIQGFLISVIETMLEARAHLQLLWIVLLHQKQIKMK